MEIVDVVRKLVGAIEPVGETHSDSQRFENLRAMTALVDELVNDLNDVSRNSVCHEHSKKKAGEFARGFLKTIGEDLRS